MDFPGVTRSFSPLPMSSRAQASLATSTPSNTAASISSVDSPKLTPKKFKPRKSRSKVKTPKHIIDVDLKDAAKIFIPSSTLETTTSIDKSIEPALSEHGFEDETTVSKSNPDEAEDMLTIMERYANNSPSPRSKSDVVYSYCGLFDPASGLDTAIEPSSLKESTCTPKILYQNVRPYYDPPITESPTGRLTLEDITKKKKKYVFCCRLLEELVR
jgi:hypothetical protein